MVVQRQLNVNLPAELVRECKHAAIDADMSLGAFVADALQRHLANLRRVQPVGAPPGSESGR
ncbi:MAG: CopG family transcriptional regulator [Acidimicrobiia bacterium]